MITIVYFKFSYKINKIIPKFTIDKNVKFLTEESLINEVRSVNKLVPLEVDLSESITIDKSFSDLDVFKKSKEITFFAHCSYSMDLSNITKNDLILDTQNKSITITLLPPQVFSINIDESKTIYGDPELGFFRFGDIELTSEEYGNVRAKIYETFKEKMNSSELTNKVISNTTTSLENLIKDLTGENYSISIKIKTV